MPGQRATTVLDLDLANPSAAIRALIAAAARSLSPAPTEPTDTSSPSFSGGDLWLLMTVGGVVVLGLVLAYRMSTNRRRAEQVEKKHGMLTEEEADRRSQ